METQNITNLLNDSINEESKFETKKWYIIDTQTANYKYNCKYNSKYNRNNFIKFETKSITWSVCDYSDACILVTGDITVNTGALNKNYRSVAFKNCVLVFTSKTEINEVFIDEANHIYIAMSICNLIECSDN